MTAEHTISKRWNTIGAHKAVVRGDGVLAKNKNTNIQTKTKKGEEYTFEVGAQPADEA